MLTPLHLLQPRELVCWSRKTLEAYCPTARRRGKRRERGASTRGAGSRLRTRRVLAQALDTRLALGAMRRSLRHNGPRGSGRVGKVVIREAECGST
eukprot:scaffold155881_cov27-Tisochrysis_lutea.AAC.2